MRYGKYIIGLILFGLSFLVDRPVALFFNNLRNKTVDIIIYFFGSELFVILLAVLITFVFIWHKKKDVIKFWLSIGSAFVLSHLLKILFHRPRPYMVYGFEPAVQTLTQNAFPSSHAMVVFAILPFLFKNYPKKRFLWVVLAVVILVMRIYAGVHFLSDIIFGAVVGYFIGEAVISGFRR
jgi:undecaprenyl-diphosphatase